MIHKKWKVEAETGCWIWQGYVTSKGYGQTTTPSHGKTVMPAHRAIYIELVGEIGEGLVLHHTCENRLCVNPDHLEPITQAEHNRVHGTLYHLGH